MSKSGVYDAKNIGGDTGAGGFIQLNPRPPYGMDWLRKDSAHYSVGGISLILIQSWVDQLNDEELQKLKLAKGTVVKGVCHAVHMYNRVGEWTCMMPTSHRVAKQE